MWNINSVIIFSLACFRMVQACERISHVNPTDLTEEQMDMLAEFKFIVENDLTSTLEKGDSLLAGALKRHGFQFDKASKTLGAYMECRNKYNLDTILKEDWTDMRAKFPFYQETVDKAGRPFAYIDLGQWNMCDSELNSFPSPELMERYLYMIQEQMQAKARASKINIEEFKFIINAGGLSALKHGCPKFERFVKLMTSHDDDTGAGRDEGDKFAVIVNVPNSFKKIYSMFSQSDKSSTDLFGQDQSKWQTKLLEEIDADQLPKDIFQEVEQTDNSDGLLHWHEEI